jgi:plasmid stabilization system protein ParE
MRAFVKHPLVDPDVEEAALWYRRWDTAIALRFVDEVRFAMRAAKEGPLRFTVRFADVRRVRLRRFPHSVFFRIRGDAVLVLAVLHGAREVEWLIGTRTLPDTKRG